MGVLRMIYVVGCLTDAHIEVIAQLNYNVFVLNQEQIKALPSLDVIEDTKICMVEVKTELDIDELIAMLDDYIYLDSMYKARESLKE